MIVDKTQFDKFVNILPELEKDEVYFLSLSARNKYLTDEERLQYGLGRTEMFSREIARDKEGIYYAMNKLKASLQYRTTRNGSPIPDKALVVYMNINPSSMIKAYQMFVHEAGREVEQIVHAYMNGKQPNFEGTKRFNRVFMNCIQKSRSRKYFIDIDIDFTDGAQGEFKQCSALLDFLKLENSEFNVIQTKSGFHILIKKETVSDMLYRKVDELRKDPGVKEIEFNKNEMVPVPGTLQGRHLVVFDGEIK